MAYVITAACIDVKDAACQVACPVDCIYEGGRMMYIQPDECISCGLCLSICPVDAIYEIADMPPEKAEFTAVNREFFGSRVTGWDRPGGAEPRFVTTIDHPVVAAFPKNSNC